MQEVESFVCSISVGAFHSDLHVFAFPVAILFPSDHRSAGVWRADVRVPPCKSIFICFSLALQPFYFQRVPMIPENPQLRGPGLGVAHRASFMWQQRFCLSTGTDILSTETNTQVQPPLKVKNNNRCAAVDFLRAHSGRTVQQFCIVANLTRVTRLCHH